MSKIVESLKNVGNTIYRIWDRLGQPDITDEDAILEGNDATAQTLRESLKTIDAFADEVYSSSATSGKAGNGGKGKHGNIVERVQIDTSNAIRNAETQQDHSKVDKERVE